MNETRTRVRVVVDTRFADLPNGLFDYCKIARPNVRNLLFHKLFG